MNNRQTKIIFGIIVIILLGVIAYLALSDRQAPSGSTLVPEPSPIVTDTATPEQPAAPASADWRTYRDAELGYEMSIPADTVRDGRFVSAKTIFNLEVKDDQYIYQEINGRQSKTLIPFKDFSFLDFEQSGQAMMGERTAAIFKAPRGYCDGPGCSEPFIAYGVEAVPGTYYVLVFYGDDALNETERHVLESFRFPEESPVAWKTHTQNSLDFSFRYPTDGKVRLGSNDGARIDNLEVGRTDADKALQSVEYIIEAGQSAAGIDCRTLIKNPRQVMVLGLETYRGQTVDGPHPGYSFTSCWNVLGKGHSITVNQATADGELADSIFNSLRPVDR